MLEAEKSRDAEVFSKQVFEVCGTYAGYESIAYMRNDDSVTRYGFEQIAERVRAVQDNLFVAGIRRGDRVAILSAISPETVVTGLALACSNVTAVLIDVTLPMTEIEQLIDTAEISGLITTKKMYAALNSLQTKKLVVFDVERVGEKDAVLLNRVGEVSHAYDPDYDVIAILFSSGTTAKMKGVMMTYESVLSAREIFVRFTGITPLMSYLAILPYNHISGYMSSMIYFLTGCGMGMIEDVNSAKLSKGLLEYNPYCFAMVPKVFDIIADKILKAIHEKGKVVEAVMLSLLKLSGFLRRRFGWNIGKHVFKPIYTKAFGSNIYGLAVLGAICKKDTARLFLNLGLEWANLYATTETNVPIAATGIFDRYPLDSVGRIDANEGIDIKIKNLDADGIGEICVKSKLMMKGYFRDNELTQSAFDTEGYFRTGDTGYVDSNNYLYIVGRIKETFVLHNGEKVSAVDVDNYYASVCPKTTVASCGVPTEGGFDKVYLFIEEGTLGRRELEEYCKEVQTCARLAPPSFKLAGVYSVNKIPVTSVGKVKRFLLSKQVEEINETTKQDGIGDMGRINSDGKVEQNVISIIQNYVTGIEVTLDSDIKNELGLDSLNLFEVCVEIENRLGIPMLTRMDNITNVSDIVNKDYQETDRTVSLENYPVKKGIKEFRFVSRIRGISGALYKIQVKGLENISTEKRLLFCPNHECYLDALWVAGVLQENGYDISPFCCLAAEHLKDKKIMRKAFYALGGIPVDRSGNTASAIKRAKECLQDENCMMLIHPEGTRTRTGKLGAFKNGAAKLSIETGVKIIPVCINGAYEIFPPSARLPKTFNWRKMRRYPLQISFGPAINPVGKTEDEITQMIRDYIVEQKGRYDEHRN